MDDDSRRKRLRPIVDSVIGASLAGVGAAGTSMIATGHKWEVFLPLAFVLILVIISAIFGARAGVLGTLIAALIFAAFLFRPMGRLSSDAARANLAWMLLLGISFSFLFAPQNSSFRRH